MERSNLSDFNLFQITLSFVTGLILSPYSYGFIFVLIFLLIYEIGYAVFTKVKYPYWSLRCRLAVVLVYILGFIVGRTLMSKGDPFDDELYLKY